jgi:hypothetical protein
MHIEKFMKGEKFRKKQKEREQMDAVPSLP